MKSIITFLIAFSLLQITSLAQEDWLLQSPQPTSSYFYGVSFTDANNGTVVGLFGSIIRTTDGGLNWISQASGTTQNLKGVIFTDANNGIAVGGDATIVKTTDGGENWASQRLEAEDHFTGVSFTDANNGTVVGRFGSIIRTTDGGENWIGQSSSPNPKILFGVCFTDANNGTVVGRDKVKITDNGPGEYDWSIILRTKDGGENWVRQISGTDNYLYGVSFTDSSNGTAVGNGGAITRTTDAGESWILQSSGVNNDLRCVQFISETVGWVGGIGTILRTTDGGANWISNQTLGLTTESIYFVDESNGWIVSNSETGNSGMIQHSTDGGQTWVVQLTVDKQLSSIQFVDEYNGWAVGDSGLILHTTNGGISFVEENETDEIPTEYYLSYNYPNPFNPITKIKYSVPQASKVVIQVFDFLGNEIETLVNEEKQTGTYELTWYAKGLPSGVYFYQIRAGDFVETKKMVLMK